MTDRCLLLCAVLNWIFPPCPPKNNLLTHRSLSLDNILSLLNAVLLEQQIVVFCPNLAIQSAIVLSLIPLLAPFQWHFTLLPITPQNMLCFLDAPLPFVLGVQYKTADVAWK